MKIGDTFTIDGVTKPDKRSRRQRLVDWVLRRPPPNPAPQHFRVIDCYWSDSQ